MKHGRRFTKNAAFKGLGEVEPPDVSLNTRIGEVEVNTAELLYAAARCVLMIICGERGVVALRGLAMHPNRVYTRGMDGYPTVA